MWRAGLRWAKLTLPGYPTQMSRVWIVSIVGAGVAIVILWFVDKTFASMLSSAALVATLIGVIWYAKKTHELVLLQRLDFQVRCHPWLTGSDLKPETHPFGNYVLSLPIKNVGTTPATNVKIKVKFNVPNIEDIGLVGLTREQTLENIMIMPGDTAHVKLIELDTIPPLIGATLDLDIFYQSLIGGGGAVELNFYVEDGCRWVNGAARYNFHLSNETAG